MTKLEAWKKFCEAVPGLDATQHLLNQSSHGKAFSYAWDAAVEAEREACAEIAEKQRFAMHISLTSHPPQNGTAVGIATEIRARGEA